MKVKEASGGSFFDRLPNKICYNQVNVAVEAFVVFLIFILNFMLAPTLNSQLRKILRKNAVAVIVFVAKQ